MAIEAAGDRQRHAQGLPAFVGVSDRNHHQFHVAFLDQFET
jgi:hypothetical protein